ncbi:Nucleoporin NUP192 [Ceratocystis lukuohia]|uniref:Nucleoporin NUP192 n=1 Tax=Ceratocystis lukuohia TaxID=2019550 RepID=A0ABR4MDF9_9PEZI
MADVKRLEILTQLHRDLLALAEGDLDYTDILFSDACLALFESELEIFWMNAGKNDKSRATVNAGEIEFNDQTFQLNDQFKKDALALADEANIDEIAAVHYMLESQDDIETMDQPLLELALIRLHRTRNFVLDIARLFVDINNSLDEEEFSEYVNQQIFADGSKRVVPRCSKAMIALKTNIQAINDKLTAASVLANGNTNNNLADDSFQTIYFIRNSLYNQHQLVAHIMSRAIDKRKSESQEFLNLLADLKITDKYDALLIHKIPVLGAFITEYASTEGRNDVELARKLNPSVIPSSDAPWPLRGLQATVKAWWIAEYGGHFMGTQPDPADEAQFELEEKKRASDFIEALKDGAFDFLLSVASDIRSPDWQDPARKGMRQWLQRRLPALPSNSVKFPDYFQVLLMSRFEIFVDGFISNLPDVIRKLRTDEDEQRQMSQAHEQDLDLERFLIIIAYAYEGRPEAAMNFWTDPDSNLAGFMQWASRRASTPLVTAFCEMLQAISANEECATCAHQFLLDEGSSSSSRLRKSLSLTWNQIMKELIFFTNKIREKPAPAPPAYRHGKPVANPMDIEPESAMMLECYLRLTTRLVSQSEEARNFLLKDPTFNLVEILFQLASNPVPPRLRACVFWTLDALMTSRSADNASVMWVCLDAWITGAYTPMALSGTHKNQMLPTSLASAERILEEISQGFEEPQAFITLLTTLVTPVDDAGPIRDTLAFPENLGASYRTPGIDLFVDYVIGKVFSNKANELEDVNQKRLIRQKCLEFCIVCLQSFNQNLIELANVTSINVDSAMGASSLEAYVKTHPFGRIMEWMMNEKVMSTIFSILHESPMEIGNSSPDSPLIQGIHNAITLLTFVLEEQPVFVNIVRKFNQKNQSSSHSQVTTTRYASFDDCLVGHLSLVVDLGLLCGIAPTDVVCASLRLLEKMSASQKIVSVWSSGSGGYVSHRNKAIVAMEADGDHEKIIGYFHDIFKASMDERLEDKTDAYIMKMSALEFLHECLLNSPTKPTIAHLLLGFKCHADSVSIDPKGAFATRKSLFHALLNVWAEIPFGGPDNVRGWLTSMKTKALMILKLLWSSPLTSEIVLDDLRMGSFAFSLLQHNMIIDENAKWEGIETFGYMFTLSRSAETFSDFLAHRAASLDYISRELCYLSQTKLPTYQRRLFDALKGNLYNDSGEIEEVPSIFDMFDFLPNGAMPEIDEPKPCFFANVIFDAAEVPNPRQPELKVYDDTRAAEILLLKRGEKKDEYALITAQEAAAVEAEQAQILDYLQHTNTTTEALWRIKDVLKKWADLVLVILESNDFQGTARTTLYLQTLQTIMPHLEYHAGDKPDTAVPLAQLAKVLLFKLDPVSKTEGTSDSESSELGDLVSDKLYQLFQASLDSISRYVPESGLRATYYSICYRYATHIASSSSDSADRRQVLSTIVTYGERFINFICDDACDGDSSCQIAALILLDALVNVSREEFDLSLIEALINVNFVSILIDSLSTILTDNETTAVDKRGEQQNVLDAKLSLLLSLCQSREGAKHVFHANLLRNIDVSGLFSVDPELHVDQADSEAMARHYSLLARMTHIISAAIISRGSQYIPSGRHFISKHRMLIMHTLKRSAGIGQVGSGLEEAVKDLADAFLVLISATDFVNFENDSMPNSELTTHVFH